MSELQIVFIDDTPEDVELAEFMLAKAGITFAAARVWSEQALLEHIAARSPDLIVSDLAIPGFDGIAALKIARRIVPEVPFILLSGSIMESHRQLAQELGALGCAAKDRPAEFIQLVRQALQSSCLRQVA